MLTWKTRVAVEEQIIQAVTISGFGGVRAGSVVRRLKTLAERDLLHRQRLDVAVLAVSAPLVCWPGGPDPDFAEACLAIAELAGNGPPADLETSTGPLAAPRDSWEVSADGCGSPFKCSTISD